MKKETKLWKLLSKKTPQIRWTRLESWASFGTPDLLGYHDNCGFFMVELKVAHSHKITFSPHQKLFHITRPKRNFILLGTDVPRSIKLYESKSIYGLMEDYRDTPSLVNDDWDEINRLLINYKKN